MFRRNILVCAQIHSSLSHTNQWSRHLSPRDTTKEMYNVLTTKGIVEANTAQQSVLELCDGLLHFINNEEVFNSKLTRLEREAAPKIQEERLLKRALQDSRTCGSGAQPAPGFGKNDPPGAKVFGSHRLAAQSKAREQWNSMRRNYRDLIDSKKTESYVQNSKRNQEKNMDEKKKKSGSSSAAGNPFSTSTFSGMARNSTTGKTGKDKSAIEVQFPSIAEGDEAMGKSSMGLYLWGDVGIGKTMMMDLFEMCPTPHHQKRRCHLHSFVTDLHRRLHNVHVNQQEMRRQGLSLEGRKDPVEQVAEEIVLETRILCFDEFQTFDVANASLLANFFKHAFRLGIVLFATSNRPPEGLLKAGKGLMRFVPELYDHCAVVKVSGVGVDYRIEKSQAGSCHDFVFQSPNTKHVAHGLIKFVGTGFKGEDLARFAAGDWEKDYRMTVYSRSLLVPRRIGGVAVFPFSHICGFGQMLGPADFQLLAKTFHTILITDVPHIAATSKNGLKQFIILVDEMYQHSVKLLFTAAVPWKKLLKAPSFSTSESDGRTYYTDEQDERTAIDPTQEVFVEGEDLFEFRTQEEVLSLDRVASRLEEMGSVSYLTKDHLDFIIEDFDLSIYELVTSRPALQV